MMRWFFIALTAVAVVVASADARAQNAAPVRVTAFADVTVIPMDRERILEQQTVLVEGGRISAIGPSSSVRPPRDALVIDGNGKFLIPGLGDAHAHLSTPGGGTALAGRALRLYALHGVTMVRSMYTEPHHLAVRDSVERGEMTGPRILLASPALHGGTAQTPAAGRDSVTKYAAEGYRLIKILPGLTRSVFDTIAATSRALGIALAGHVPAAVGLDAAVASGYVSVEHLDGFVEAMIRAGAPAAGSGFFGYGLLDAIDESQLPRITATIRRAGTTIVPTEFSMESYASADSVAIWMRRPELRFVPPSLVEQWSRQKEAFMRQSAITADRAQKYRDIRRRIIHELHAAGVPIALGSDAFTMFGVPGIATFEELAIFVNAGLSNFDALRTSTVNVARLMGIAGLTGTVTAGAMADLVLLDANPLADIANVRRQAGVMLRGAWYPRREIEQRLETLSAR